MKINKILIITIIIILSICSFAYAEEKAPIKVQLDGNIIDFTDANGNKVDATIVNNRTMVPMRKIFEIFDAKVDWDEASQTVTANTKEKQIVLQINNNVAKVKDLINKVETEINLDQAPIILNNRTIVPVRFISESLEKEVGWDEGNQTVIIIDYNKIEEKVSQKLKEFQKILDSNLDSVKSFKMESILDGKLLYQGLTASQSIDFNGIIKLAMNASGDIQNEVKVGISGTDNALLKVVKSNGYDAADYSLIVKDNKVYYGEKSGDKYNWKVSKDDVSSIYDISSIYNYGKLAQTLSGYIKQSITKYDIDTYKKIMSMVEDVSNILTEKSVVITDSGAVRAVSAKLDLSKLLSYNKGDGSDNSLIVDINITFRNDKIEQESIKISRTIKLLEESMNLEFNFASKYSDLNGKIDIKAPTI